MYRKTQCTDDTEFIVRLRDLKLNNSEITRKMNVSEGTIRYHLKRRFENKTDGRKNKVSSVAAYKSIINNWITEYQEKPRRSTILKLHENLVTFHNYTLSYDALRRYIRKHHPAVLAKSACLRIETPPGVLLQIDWKENIAVQIGRLGNWIRISLLVCILCFSRKTVVCVSDRKDSASLLHCQQEALRKLGGLPQYIRPDCMKTAVVKWNGQQSVINEQYRKYVEKLGIQVFPARPRTPTDKGKIEKRIQDVMDRLAVSELIFKNLDDLQGYIDGKIREIENHWLCGATGAAVEKSYQYERKFLKSLPDIFPAIPIKEARTTVRRDGTAYFDGNYYQVGQEFCDRSVLCVNSGSQIHIHGGEEIETYYYLPQAKGMVRLSRNAILEAQTPLSPTVRAWALEVAERQVEYYEAISQGGKQ